ncbi:MAG: LytR C-terminal domain-containing protein, partial [Leptospira sp.]|nr:LytR C-terminal domain-containing protein [Leptospira sp.]
IDILGGIPVYLDNNSVISSEKFSRKYGENSMSGEEVADYLKIADKNTPKEYVERLGRQESVLLTFYDNLPSVKQAIRKEWLSFLFGLIETNLAAEELYTLYDYVTSNHFIFSISELPGEPAEHPKSKKKFLQIKEDTAKTAFSRFEKNITSDYFLDGETARVEVLNGTDVTGLAKRVKSILNDKRFKVLSTDNGWLNNQKNTIVIDRSGNAEYSYRIAEALGSKKIRHNIKKESGLDATVLVGEDFEINP